MTQRQYLNALKELGLTPASKDTALAIGLTVRQLQRIAGGESKVPGPVMRLLRIMIAYKIHPANVPTA